jgi:D-alanine-D-alanine ligase-like ATP-grasp enzyme
MLAEAAAGGAKPGVLALARVDFIVTRDCAVCALEVNTTPGMS